MFATAGVVVLTGGIIVALFASETLSMLNSDVALKLNTKLLS
jgi:hypothetical protein